MKGYALIIGVLAVILIALLVLSVSFQQTLQMETAEQFNKQQLLLATAEASNIQTYLSGVKEALLHITTFASSTREPDFALLTDMIFKDVGSLGKRIEFLDRRGNILFEKGALVTEGQEPPDLDALAKRWCPSGVMTHQDTKRYTLVAPACRAESRVGAVIVSIDIQDIASVFLGPIKSGSRVYAWMMDDKGNLLYHPAQPDMVGRNLYKADSSCFGCHKTFDVEKKIVEGKGETVGRHVAPTGEDKILAFATASAGDARWIVAVSAPYSEVTLSIKRSTRLYTWIIILIFLTTSGVAAVMIAINRKREQAEERARHEKSLEMMHFEKLAFLERLTSGITSEIGNPLTSVFSFVQVLMDMEEDEFKKETLETIFFHMNRISDILKQLSGFSKMSHLELKPWKVNSIIENTLSLIQYDTRVQGITIVRELSPDVPAITTDGSQLAHVIVNIVLNAADAMPNGGTLTIRSRTKENAVVVDFHDTGIGIEREKVGRIFDPFYTTKAHGTGLGLAVSYNIIKKLSGDLSVESEPNKGTKFTISLPLESVKDAKTDASHS